MSDSWQPSCNLDAMRLRARLLTGIREFFTQKNLLEVETPCLSHAATTDPYIESLRVNPLNLPTGNDTAYLQTSPEFFMKRLLAMGSGDIYQIGKVFRNEEYGKRHNPEFTLLEWYRTSMTYHELMREVAELVAYVLPEGLIETAPAYTSYREVFFHHLDLDPLTASMQELENCALQHAVNTSSDLSRDDWLNLLMSHVVEPALERGKMNFIFDYPSSQASLARTRFLEKSSVCGSEIHVAERFELIINGVELANGYQELTDAREQEKRFLDDVALRQSRGLPVVPFDVNLVLALQAGLPECAGVALGVDRLCMIINQSDTIQDVLTFSIDRC